MTIASRLGPLSSIVTFFVPGLPQTAGSKTAIPMQGKDGRLHVAMRDGRTRKSAQRHTDWRACVALAAQRALGNYPPSTWPIQLELAFQLMRPRSHRTSRGDLRLSASGLPTTRPDLLKLARSVEDACTGILWVDDAQIVREELVKSYADFEGSGVTVSVWAIRDLWDVERIEARTERARRRAGTA
jgi:Holliday junction resolvase RusA-like endonuclease